MIAPVARVEAGATPASSGVAARGAALLQIALVVFFGPPEGRGGRDLGHDRAAKAAAGLQLVARGNRRRLLLRGVEEDRRAVLRPLVRTLLVQRGRVVVGPEHFQQPL